jgi:hypothetical protein
LQLGQFVGGSGVHVEPALLVTDAKNNSAAFVGPAAAEDAKNSAPQRDIAELLRVVVEITTGA